MPQDNFDDQIKNLFGKMDYRDDAESLGRKEAIWERLDINKKQAKKDRRLWLLLLFCPLFFAAGWFLRSPHTTENFFEETDVNLNDGSPDLQVALVEAQRRLELNNRQIDSLKIRNMKLLSNSVKASKKVASPSPSVQNIYVRDTVYLTEFKIEERVVERIIRDTIRIDLPPLHKTDQAIAKVNDSSSELDIKSIKETSGKPRSVQYNFSETNSNK